MKLYNNNNLVNNFRHLINSDSHINSANSPLIIIPPTQDSGQNYFPGGSRGFQRGRGAAFEEMSGFFKQIVGKLIGMLEKAIGKMPEGSNLEKMPEVKTETPSTSAVGNEIQIPENQTNYGRLVRKSGELAWKPNGKNGPTALLRKRHNGNVKNVNIYGPNGSLVSTGKVVGTTKNGRPKVIFDKPADQIPNGSKMVIDFLGGGKRHVDISDAGSRFKY